ncbi:MAG TPA: NHL repeat-containing protein [Candidatus Binataceae bacterium]|nr:NHL repeat-containing protein [Candidatus Binataceae bacterium]
MNPGYFRSRPSATPLWGAALLTLVVLLVAGCTRHEDASAAPEKLFVTVPERRQLVIYEGDAAGSAAPLQVITEDAPDQPVDVAVDFVGEAFVANANGNIRVYAPHEGTQYKIFKNYEGSNTRIQHPTAIAVNKAGSFFVADAGNGVGRLEWVSGGANGNLVPDRVIEGADTGIRDPRGVALDGSGRVFVADRTANQVLVFAADANGDATPIARLEGLHAPGHLAVDDVMNVYVANEADNTIAVFGSSGPESWTLSATITSKALSQPTGVTTDAAGEIATGAIGGVLFFAGNARGNADPIRIMTASDPLHPAGICIH